MTIGITGASGDIGGSFLMHAAKKSTINALVREGKTLRTDDIEVNVKRFEFRDGSTYHAELLRSFADCDAVVHSAAILNTGGTLAEYLATNTLFTGLLAMECLESSAQPKLIYISSEMVYTLPDAEAVDALAQKILSFCKKQLTPENSLWDLQALAEKFIASTPFPYDRYNTYALTKYLGEALVQEVSRSTILRVTNAYGPDYDNMRLIPRLITSRLTGHGMTYSRESRDFVYSDDINRLIDAAISGDVIGIVDCKSGEVMETQFVRDTIVYLTPTAYGSLKGKEKQSVKLPRVPVAPAATSLAKLIGKPTPFIVGLTATIHHHKEQTYHDMDAVRPMEDFLQPGEKIVEFLHGSSAAYLCIVVGGDDILKIRKVAIRDGVEGNGVAKVANEIRYYKHILRHEPVLAKMYPRLLNSEVNHAFSAETIEYFNGQNYYASLKSQEVSYERHKQALQRFIDALCNNALQHCIPAKDPENNLNSYYLERSITRLRPIAKHIEVKDWITINGEQLQAPHIILQKLLDNELLRHLILPHLEAFCFHGDLTLLNTVYMKELNEIKLIDPRGHIGSWDPLYDFGKIKFTLSGFGEFILGSQEMVKPTKYGYEVYFDEIAPAARRLNDSFFGMLADSPSFKEKIIKHEPYWQYRIALAEATHYLADIPFRLFTDEGTWSAIASYVVGTRHLNRVYKKLLDEVGA